MGPYEGRERRSVRSRKGELHAGQKPRRDCYLRRSTCCIQETKVRQSEELCEDGEVGGCLPGDLRGPNVTGSSGERSSIATICAVSSMLTTYPPTVSCFILITFQHLSCLIHQTVHGPYR